MFNVNEKDRAWVDAQCTSSSQMLFAETDAQRARERIGKKAYIERPATRAG
jgi:hypothetical protein